jgi:chromosome segregation ATPase
VAARLEDLRGAVEQKLERPDGTADVLERLERLDESLRDATARDHELRAVLEQPREDLAGRMGGIEHALGEAHRRLDDLRAALDQPRTDDAILDRLDALEALVRTKSEARLAELEQGIEEAHVAELAERDARIAELTGRVEQLSAQAAAAASARDAAGPQAGEPTSFLALVPRFESYELVALEGPLPAPGSRLDVDDEDMPFVVSRVGRSPLPADTRPCVYLEPR